MGALISKIAWNLVLQLITEKFFKGILVSGMEAGAKSSKTDMDDKAVKYIKEAWKIK
jgi:hypothetical protein